jgi:2-oxoglutarate ferredoxin oxidoreductase subunit delta
MVKRGGTKKMSEAEEKPSKQHHPRAAAAESSFPEKTKKAFEIDIFRGWCKSCGICAAFCPRECIGQDENGSPVVIDANRCSGCGWCELHCPDFAVSVRPRLVKAAPSEEG